MADAIGRIERQSELYRLCMTPKQSIYEWSQSSLGQRIYSKVPFKKRDKEARDESVENCGCVH